MSPTDPNHRLVRQTLVDGAYEALKAQLMSNQLQPGERLNMEALGRELGVSPTPIREALAALEREGLVTKESLIGYAVGPRPDRESFDALWEARLILEPSTARLAALRATSEDLAELHNQLELRERSSAPSDAESIMELATHDTNFHRAVALAAHNDPLLDWYDRMHVQVHLFRLRYESSLDEPTCHEHRGIVAAIEAGDAELAQQAMQDHLTKTRVRIISIYDI